MAGSTIWMALFFLLLSPAGSHSQGVTIVEIGDIKIVRSLSAIVTNVNEFPMEGVLVEEMSPGWKTCLRTTKTDSKGSFMLAPVKARDIYYIQLTYKTFNPLRVRMRIDPKHGTDVRLKMTPST